MEKQNLAPYNNKPQPQPHGYWEDYYSDGNICYKGNYINGEKNGLWEWYNYNGELMVKEYLIL